MILSDRTILLTGGGTGIGLELAKLLVSKGNTVMICGRRQQKLDEAKQQVPGLHCYSCDISQPEQCKQLLQSINQDGFKVDVLINNAAGFGFVDFSDPDFDIESIRSIVNTNLMAPIDLVKLFLPDLLQANQGVIINVCSPAGRVPLNLVPMYSATKAGMDSWTRTLRCHLANKIKVVEVFPPTVETEMTVEVDSGSLPKMSSKECAQKILLKLEKGQEEIWVGLDSNLFRIMNAIMPWWMFGIVNGSNGPTRKTHQ